MDTATPTADRVDIRHIATALDRDDVVAFGAFEKHVRVLHLGEPSVATSFDTVLDFGGKRLALCTPGDRLVVVAGAWERHGVCGYDGQTGERLWQRTDLKRVQSLAPAGIGGYVAATLDRRSMHVLDATNGETRAKVRGADRLWQSRYGPVAVTGAYESFSLIDAPGWTRQWKARVNSFALLDVGFAPDGLVVSDTGGTVYCYNLTGDILWRQRGPVAGLCWDVDWDEDSDQFVGLRHREAARTDVIIRWSRTGDVLSTMEIESVVDAEFLPGGRRLVTTESVVDTRSGRSINHSRYWEAETGG